MLVAQEEDTKSAQWGDGKVKSCWAKINVWQQGKEEEVRTSHNLVNRVDVKEVGEDEAPQ